MIEKVFSFKQQISSFNTFDKKRSNFRPLSHHHQPPHRQRVPGGNDDNRKVLKSKETTRTSSRSKKFEKRSKKSEIRKRKKGVYLEPLSHHRQPRRRSDDLWPRSGDIPVTSLQLGSLHNLESSNRAQIRNR